MEREKQTVECLSREIRELRERLREREAIEAECEVLRQERDEWEMRFLSIAHVPKHAIVCLDREYRVTFWGQGAVNMFGYAAEDLLDKPISTVIPELDDEARRLQLKHQLSADEQRTIGRTLELEGVKKGGERFPVELCCSSWKAHKGPFLSAIVRDITYRKKALRTLELRTEEARSRTEEFETLIQSVAHDMKSPVIAINGLVQVLMRSTEMLPPDSSRDHILKQIGTSAHTMEIFLKDLLDALSPTHAAHEWESVELFATIDEVVRQHEQEMIANKINIEIHLDENLPPVFGDRRRIAQVLDNLIVNAIRHMGEKTHPTVRIRCVNKPSFVLISVSDNGVGIPAEYRARVFDRFFRAPGTSAEAKSTGLGLFISKKIVESHKGRIWVESEENKGATFSFTLPKFVPGKGIDYEI